MSGEKRSRDARFLRSRAALRDALVRLLRVQDLASITVQRLVAEAGVGYATFFRHFPSIEALLIDVADAMIAEFIAQAMPAIQARDRAAMLGALSAYADTHRRTVQALLVGGGAVVRREVVARAIEQSGSLATNFDPAIPASLAMAHAVGASMEVLAWWAREEPPPAPSTLPDLLDRLALCPLSI